MTNDATWQITVQIKGGQSIDSPMMERDEAERQLGLIRSTLGSRERPDVPWMAAMGTEILAASVWQPA